MENPLEITIPYKVGFKRPPNHTRFQEGLSGNPDGRTREIRPLEAALSKVIFRQAGSKDDKKEKPISNLEAMVRSMVQRAIDGDAAAFREVMHLAIELGIGTESRFAAHQLSLELQSYLLPTRRRS